MILSWIRDFTWRGVNHNGLRVYGYAVTVVIFMTMAFTTGCSVNRHGLIDVCAYESETAYMIHLTSWGIHLSTLEADAGISIGRICKTYVVQKANSGAGHETGDLTLSFLFTNAELTPMKEVPDSSEMGKMVAIADRVAGARVYVNAWRGIGLVLGFQNVAVLRLPVHFKGIIALNVDTTGTGKNLIDIQEEEK